MKDLSVLIPYKGDNGPRDRIFAWLLARYEALLPDAEIVIGTSEPFSRAAARNDAFRRCTGDTLLVADADTIFHVEQIREAIEVITTFKYRNTWVLPYGKQSYYNLSQEATEKVLSQQPIDDIPEPTDPSDWEFKLESWAGLLVMPRAAYVAVGGYDERFCGWGREDSAMKCALNTLWGQFCRLSEAYVLHLWHPVSHETTFGQPHYEENQQLFLQYQRAEGSSNTTRAVASGHHL